MPVIVSVPGDRPGPTVPPLFDTVVAVTVPVPFSVPPLRFNVPVTLRLPPLSFVSPAVCVNPLAKLSVPVCTSTAPLFVNTFPSPVAPVPPLLRNVPPAWLSNSASAPLSAPPKLDVNIAPSNVVRKSEPLRLRIRPDPSPRLPFSTMNPALHVAPPRTSSTRPASSVTLPLIVSAPCVSVLPAPVMIPSENVVTPLTITVPVPASVPPLCVKVVSVTSCPARFAVPLLPIVSVVPRLVSVPVKFAVPPLTVVALVTLYVPPTVTVPPANVAWAVVMLLVPSSVCVPPVNCSVPAPLKLPVCVLPAVRSSVPVCTSTVPLLMNTLLIVVAPVPPLLRNVAPAWLSKNASAPLSAPPKFDANIAPPNVVRKSEPLRLRIRPDPSPVLLFRLRNPAAHVAPPRTSSTRPASSVTLPLIVSAPCVSVLPAPVMIPSENVVTPLTITVPVPCKVPPLRARLATVVVPFAVSVPLLMASVPVISDRPLTVSVPADTVTLPAPKMPVTLEVPLDVTVTPAPMLTMSAAPGAVPPLQLLPMAQLPVAPPTHVLVTWLDEVAATSLLKPLSSPPPALLKAVIA